MIAAQRKALFCLFIGGAIFVSWGSYLAWTSPYGMSAFKAIFYGARSLLRHSDPYNPAVFQQVYQSEGGKFPSDQAEALLFRRGSLVCVNLPTSLFLIAPLAILPWKLASLVWMMLTAGCFSLATFLIWKVAKEDALKPATLLIALLLSNSPLIVALGNLSGIAISLCLFAAWSFLEEKFARAGVICLAISLVLKPHDAGLVWLFFLLAGGIHRKRAIQTLGIAAVLMLASVLWISHVAPQWPQEFRANLHMLSAHGSVNDPGPDSLTFISADYVISLQSPLSLIRDNPRFYNPASYLICGLLLLAGAFRVTRSRFTKQSAWIGLAAVAALSMLPVYHRTYDARLILLAVPACALLWKEGGRLKWIAGAMTTLAVACAGDVTTALLLGMTQTIRDGMGSLGGKLLAAFAFHPAPVILLATGIFYLWAYFLRTARERREFGLEIENTASRSR